MASCSMSAAHLVSRRPPRNLVNRKPARKLSHRCTYAHRFTRSSSNTEWGFEQNVRTESRRSFVSSNIVTGTGVSRAADRTLQENRLHRRACYHTDWCQRRQLRCSAYQCYRAASSSTSISPSPRLPASARKHCGSFVQATMIAASENQVAERRRTTQKARLGYATA